MSDRSLISRLFRRDKAAVLPPDAAAFSPYFATQESPSRKRLHTFGTDTKTQLTPWARKTLIVKSRTLVENYGPARSLWNLSRLVGALRPQANSGDAEWDALAEARFKEIAYSPLIFDASGRFTFETWQSFASYRRYTDGDLFSILSETSSKTARIIGREAHQVNSDSNDGWYDGVRTDANGFPLAYRFEVPGDSSKSYPLPSLNVHHHATWNTLGGVRGQPALAHFINDGHDLIETKAFVKRAIKQAADIGLTRKADQSKNGLPPDLTGVGSPVHTSVYQPPGSQPGGAARLPERITYEDVMDGGKFSHVPLDVIHDDRPHPNAMAFRDELFRECAIGLGVPPSILFFMEDKGGANARVDLDIFARFVVDQHVNYNFPFCQRFWTYAIAKEMKEGRLPYPSKGEFWKVRWTPPRSLTADMGKMGNLLIAMRKALLTSYARHYEELGLHYEDELEQCAKECELLIKLEGKYKLPAGMLTNSLLPPNASAAAPADKNEKTEPPPANE